MKYFVNVSTLKTEKILIFQPAYRSSLLWVAKAYSSNSGRKVGTHLGEDALPSQGASHPHPQSAWDKLDRHFTDRAHLSDVGVNGRSQRKPSKPGRNVQTDSGPGLGNQFPAPYPINIIMKRHWTKQLYSLACCIEVYGL